MVHLDNRNGVKIYVNMVVNNETCYGKKIEHNIKSMLHGYMENEWNIQNKYLITYFVLHILANEGTKTRDISYV